MSDGWLDKAKEAALKAAEEAKKLAETAKNANYSEMYDKTKAMAQQAADEAKKAADTVSSAMSKPKVEETAAATAVDPAKNLELCMQQLQKVENLLAEIKALLLK